MKTNKSDINIRVDNYTFNYCKDNNLSIKCSFDTRTKLPYFKIDGKSFAQYFYKPVNGSSTIGRKILQPIRKSPKTETYLDNQGNTIPHNKVYKVKLYDLTTSNFRNGEQRLLRPQDKELLLEYNIRFNKEYKHTEVSSPKISIDANEHIANLILEEYIRSDYTKMEVLSNIIKLLE
jgi:hypothetical protein